MYEYDDINFMKSIFVLVLLTHQTFAYPSCGKPLVGGRTLKTTASRIGHRDLNIRCHKNPLMFRTSLKAGHIE